MILSPEDDGWYNYSTAKARWREKHLIRMFKPLSRLSSRSAIRYLGSIAAAFLIVYLLSQQGWQEVGKAISRIGLDRFMAALALLFVSRLAVAARWHILLRCAGVNASLGQSLRLTFAGLFAANFLPTTIGGDAVRFAGAIKFGFDGATAAASLIVDRLIGLIGMALVLPIGISRILQSGVSSQGAWPGISLFVLFALTTTFSLGRWYQQARQNLDVILKKIWRALSHWAKQPAALALSLLFSFTHMTFLFWAMTLLLGAMGQNISLWLLGGLWSLVYFIALVPVSLNGLGVTEVSIAFILPTFGGISEQSGLTLALLFRLLLMLASLPGAGFLPSLLPQIKQHEDELTSPSGDNA